MGIPDLFIVLAIMFLVMLPLYQLIGKRILYNINTYGILINIYVEIS